MFEVVLGKVVRIPLFIKGGIDLIIASIFNVDDDFVNIKVLPPQNLIAFHNVLKMASATFQRYI